ncbi:MAG: hypothetical protein WC346_07850 [Methanogenium sp.]|jgi:hypothetical protein
MKTTKDKIILKKLASETKVGQLVLPRQNGSIFEILEIGDDVKHNFLVKGQRVKIDSDSKTVKQVFVDEQEYTVCLEEDILIIFE